MSAADPSSCRQQHFRTPKCKSSDPPFWGSDSGLFCIDLTGKKVGSNLSNRAMGLTTLCVHQARSGYSANVLNTLPHSAHAAMFSSPSRPINFGAGAPCLMRILDHAIAALAFSRLRACRRRPCLIPSTQRDQYTFASRKIQSKASLSFKNNDERERACPTQTFILQIELGHVLQYTNDYLRRWRLLE